MIGIDVDFDIEELARKYKKIGLFMPVVSRDYNNRLAFNTRSLSKRNIRAKTVQRSGSTRFITGGRVLSVRTAKFSKNIERIVSEVGGRVVPQARDPMFMSRLEFGGRIPAGRFGQTAIPSVKGARRGSVSANIPRGLTAPFMAATAVTARNVSAPQKQKRAIALSVALRQRKKTVKMRDSRGRESLYRVRGKGRGRNRKISEVKKMWTLSKRSHSTRAIHWLSDAVESASAERVKVFRRVAEFHIRRRALRGR